MMKLRDIIEGFVGGYALGFVYVILYILIKGFITWNLGLDNFDLIWKSYGLARALTVAGFVGVVFIWAVKYEGVGNGVDRSPSASLKGDKKIK